MPILREWERSIPLKHIVRSSFSFYSVSIRRSTSSTLQWRIFGASVLFTRNQSQWFTFSLVHFFFQTWKTRVQSNAKKRSGFHASKRTTSQGKFSLYIASCFRSLINNSAATRDFSDCVYSVFDLLSQYLTIRPVARKGFGYGPIAHEAKPNGPFTRGPWGRRV